MNSVSYKDIWNTLRSKKAQPFPPKPSHPSLSILFDLTLTLLINLAPEFNSNFALNPENLLTNSVNLQLQLISVLAKPKGPGIFFSKSVFL